ncbi:DDE-type integrase/transposase/recombinase [Alicyclobacillus shizuokensis]|uniref:DDE-type integrase/transposase/recombinase n=1 Tax=Alicyclobacillus shizuokensis TaxID=392014 RepID=UPI00357156A2
MPTDEGWLYLASMMDLFTRKIVGWHADSRMTKALALQALEMAIRRERPTSPVIHHSDRVSIRSPCGQHGRDGVKEHDHHLFPLSHSAVYLEIGGYWNR